MKFFFRKLPEFRNTWKSRFKAWPYKNICLKANVFLPTTWLTKYIYCSRLWSFNIANINACNAAPSAFIHGKPFLRIHSRLFLGLPKWKWYPHQNSELILCLPIKCKIFKIKQQEEFLSVWSIWNRLWTVWGLLSTFWELLFYIIPVGYHVYYIKFHAQFHKHSSVYFIFSISCKAGHDVVLPFCTTVAS